ncbi:hypothetical protein BCR42DRAFT_121089 [Absidia repens]|uniref:Man1/Src1-like C-terminal domain-containing protein n=1 Tax=Absidia repens TaxID=90262 RepID=A0A1X2I4D3_9FUNG|nr:hypothetical protein BCR42DRAFT_121089 [Absidia repens]
MTRVDQQLETTDDTHLTASHCPAIQNQQQLPIQQSIKADYLYLISKYIIPCALILFIFVHYIHLQATLRDIGYCDSMYGNESGIKTVEIGGVKRSCLPCPTNGICSGGELSCPPPYSPHRSISNRLRNIVWPTAKKCVKDPIIIKHVSKMERDILSYLAQRQGEQQCREYMSFTELPNSQHSSIPFHRVKTKMASMIMDLQPTFSLPTTLDQDYNRMDYLIETALEHVLENKHVSRWVINDELYLGTDLLFQKILFGSSCKSDFLDRIPSMEEEEIRNQSYY